MRLEELSRESGWLWSKYIHLENKQNKVIARIKTEIATTDCAYFMYVCALHSKLIRSKELTTQAITFRRYQQYNV